MRGKKFVPRTTDLLKICYTTYHLKEINNVKTLGITVQNGNEQARR